MHGTTLHGAGNGTRWLAHPVALAQETARSLGSAAAEKHGDLEALSAQLVARLRGLGGASAANLRLRAVEAALSALLQGARGADASALQDRIESADRRRPSEALALALARVLTLRITRKASAEGIESPRLASSALKALERAWAGPDNAALRRKLQRIRTLDDSGRRLALAELLLSS